MVPVAVNVDSRWCGGHVDVRWPARVARRIYLWAPHYRGRPVHPNLRNYLDNGFHTVEGWASDQLFQTIDLLSSLDINRSGGCAEIGVHRGKFYLLLNQVVDAGERSWAIDVFDNQELNVDGSGSGWSDYLATFQANLQKFDAHGGANTEIVVGDSTDPALNLESRIGLGALRFMSVDGGHTAEHTISDLHLASRVISNQGVVILDDILNPHWLGVIEGAFRFLSTHPTLVPFAIGHNKLYLCKLSYHDRYLNEIAACALFTKVVDFCGYRLAAL
jgi:hypothetical protein